MPNWSDNMLRVSGDMDEVMRFHNMFLGRRENLIVEQVKVDGSKEIVAVRDAAPNLFMWNTLRPEGDEEAKYPHDGYWYDWNCANWGTKWDLRDQRFEIGDDFVEYYFLTPWGPPTLWIDKMAQRHPTLRWVCEWDEEGGFYGEIIWDEGDVVHSMEKNRYDAP